MIFSARDGSEARGHRDGHSWFADAVIRAIRGHCADREGTSRWLIDTSRFEATVAELLEIQSRDAGRIQLATREGSRHFPLLELSRPPRMEVIRQLVDRSKQLRDAFSRLTVSKLDAALPREDLVREIKDMAATHGSGLLWLLGPPGSGKSTAIAHTSKAIAGSIPIYFSRTEGVHSLRDVHDYVLAAIDGWLTEEGRRLNGMERWSHFEKGAPMRVLLIDGIDEASEQPREASDLGLPSKLPAGVVVVLGMRGVEPPAFASNSVQRPYRFDRENPDQQSLVSQFVRSRIANSDRTAVVQTAEGNFLHAKLMLDLFSAGGLDPKAVSEAAKRSLEGTVTLAFERAIAGVDDLSLAKAVLAAIAVAAEPVSSRMIAAMVGAPLYDVEETLNGFGQGLVNHRTVADRQAWRFEHTLFAQIAYRRFGGRRLEQGLVDGLLAGKWSRLEHGAYAARWQTHHMRKLGMQDELRRLVLHRDWIESQLTIDPTARLVGNDLDRIECDAASLTSSAALAEAFVLALVRSSTQAWWRTGDNVTLSLRDLMHIGVMTPDDVSHLLLSPALPHIAELSELIELCDPQDVQSAIAAWLEFARGIVDEPKRRDVLLALLPRLDQAGLTDCFDQVREFKDELNGESLLREALERHAILFCEAVNELWQDLRELTRRAISSCLQSDDCNLGPEVAHQLARLLLSDPQFAHIQATALVTLVNTEVDPVARDRWIVFAASALAHDCSERTAERLISGLTEPELCLAWNSLRPNVNGYTLKVLIEKTSWPKRQPKELLAAVLELDDASDRFICLALLIGAGALPLQQVADYMLADVPSLDVPWLRERWFHAALNLLEAGDLGAEDRPLAELVWSTFVVLSESRLLHLPHLVTNRGHPVTCRIATTLSRQAVDDPMVFNRFGPIWLNLLPFSTDRMGVAKLLVLAIEDEMSRGHFEFISPFSSRFTADVIDAAFVEAATLPDRERALYCSLALSAVFSRPCCDVACALASDPAVDLRSKAAWQWHALVGYIDRLPQPSRTTQWASCRHALESKLNEQGRGRSNLPVVLSEAISRLLKQRRSCVNAQLSRILHSELARGVWAASDLHALRATPQLLGTNLQVAWKAFGANLPALNEILGWGVGEPWEIRCLLTSAAVGEDSPAAARAIELLLSGDTVSESDVKLGLQRGVIDCATAIRLADRFRKNSHFCLSTLLYALYQHDANVGTLDVAWNLEWSLEQRTTAYLDSREDIPELRTWVLERLVDWMERHEADSGLLRHVRDLLYRGVSSEISGQKVSWSRLVALERRIARRLQDESWCLPKEPDVSLQVISEVAALLKQVEDGQTFRLATLVRIWGKTSAADIVLRGDLIRAISRTDLWEFEDDYSSIDWFFPHLEYHLRERIKEKIFVRFLGTNWQDPREHYLAAGYVAPILNDEDIGDYFRYLEGTFSPPAASALLGHMARRHGGECWKVAAAEAAIRLARHALEEFQPALCIEVLKNAAPMPTSLFAQVASLVGELPSAVLQGKAIDATQWPKDIQLRLARACGPKGPIGGFVVSNASEEVVRGALAISDFPPAFDYLRSLSLEGLSNCASPLFEALLPHLSVDDARRLHENLVRALM
jgi:hypothetical protein